MIPVVILPVHDEAALLPACLRALDAAIAQVARGLCVVVLDACSDASGAIARAWPRAHVLEVHERNVGRARAAGVAYALGLLAESPSEIWIATTDADSEVPPDWLAAQLRYAADGIDAFAGTIDVPDGPPGFAAFYEGDGEPHGHVHGANLGVRADAYLAAGGFAALATGEDHALWNALASHRRYKTRGLAVRTSARRIGRAPAGFSEFLRRFTS